MSLAMKQSLLAYAQLLRLPNVFTAFADIAMSACAAGYVLEAFDTFALLLMASGSLYCGGMVWNDIFDRREDRKTQAFRPIPSGRVPVQNAVGIGIITFALGIGCGAIANVPLEILIALPAMILLYNSWLKHTPLGPVAMGACRFLNVLMGLSGSGLDIWTDLNLHLAATTGLYIVGVTWFARTEESISGRRSLTAASVVIFVAIVLAVTVPSHLAAERGTVFFPYLLVAFSFLIGVKLVAAIQQPGPKPVQAAIKRCILGLIVLDAILATAFVGLPGLLILLLLPPALWLGKWVYST